MYSKADVLAAVFNLEIGFFFYGNQAEDYKTEELSEASSLILLT